MLGCVGLENEVTLVEHLLPFPMLPSPVLVLYWVTAACQLHSKLSQSYFQLWIVVKSLILLGAGRDKG